MKNFRQFFLLFLLYPLPMLVSSHFSVLNFFSKIFGFLISTLGQYRVRYKKLESQMKVRGRSEILCLIKKAVFDRMFRKNSC